MGTTKGSGRLFSPALLTSKQKCPKTPQPVRSSRMLAACGAQPVRAWLMIRSSAETAPPSSAASAAPLLNPPTSSLLAKKHQPPRQKAAARVPQRPSQTSPPPVISGRWLAWALLGALSAAVDLRLRSALSARLPGTVAACTASFGSRHQDPCLARPQIRRHPLRLHRDRLAAPRRLVDSRRDRRSMERQHYPVPAQWRRLSLRRGR